MKREKEEQQRQKKDKKTKKGISSSSSTSATSSSTTESSSSSDDSSSTSSSTSADSRRRKAKNKKLKRDSSSSASETDRVSKKKSNRSGKPSVKGGSSPPPTKKAPVARRVEDQRSSSTKRRESSPPARKAPPASKSGQQPARRRSLTPVGRNSSGHRRRSQTPPHSTGGKNKTTSSARSSLGAKQPGAKHQSPRPNRSLSLDRKDKHNRSVSPLRPSIRDRDRDRDRDKEKDRERERERERDKEREREREKEKEREKDRGREKEKERERDKEKEREREREKDHDRGRSRSPKTKAKDRSSHSPRRDSRPPKDLRKKDSPDSGNSKDKGYRISPAKSRSSTGGGRGRDGSLDSKRTTGKSSPRDLDRRDVRDSWSKHGDARKDHERGREKDERDSRRADASDRGLRDGLGGKDRGSRETTLERGGGSRVGKEDSGSRRDDGVSSRKRESQMLPGIVEKTAQDRDFMSKSRDHGDGDRDRDRERGREPRDTSRDNRDGREIRDNRDPRDNRDSSRDGRDTKDSRDNLDPRLSRDARSTRESREAARDKEREEALERCRERQREREREKELNKAREYERELPSLLSLMTHNPSGLKQPPSCGSKNSADFHSGPKGVDKILDRGSDRDRGLDRGSDRDRGVDRGSDRDRALDRVSDRDRGLERGPERDRGLSRGLDRGSDRDRGLERIPDRDRPSDRERGSDRERTLDRGLDRGLGRGPERIDRGLGRGSDRGQERSSERGTERGLERGPDRNFDRVSDRGFDRSSERGLERGPERGFERSLERTSHLDRESRDNHSDRDYPLPPRNRESDGRRPPPEDKEYDSPFESRRVRDDRSRYSDQMERNRYDDPAPQREDPRGLVDRRLDPRNFSEDRRGRREGHSSMEPLRGRDPWDGRERDPRERDREQRDRERERELHERERDLREREQERRRGYEREEPRPPGPSIKGRDWETRDYTDSRREWDGRGRRGLPPEWENVHRGEWGDKEGPHPIPHAIEGEWGCFPGPGADWAAGGWVEEWGERQGAGLGPSGRPPPRMLPPHREESQSLLPRDEPAHEDGTKKLHEDTKDKESVLDVKEEKLVLQGTVKVDESPIKKPGEAPDLSVSGKRPRPATDGEADKPEAKKLCLEDSAPLEGDLSDISDDDADEILNREDSVEEMAVAVDGNDVALALSHGTAEGPSTPLYHRGTDEHPELTAARLVGEPVTQVPAAVPVALGAREPEREAGERDERLPSTVLQEINIDSQTVLMSSRIEERQQDEETMDNLDFEEISDEELDPEEAKTGIGDALGVDWASLVAESRPRTRPDSTPGSARRRWESRRVLARLGVSARYGGWDLVEDLKAKYNGVKQETEKDGKENAAPEPETGTVAKEEVSSLSFLHPVASIHVALRERQARRTALFASCGPYKRALSARRDLAIRRQLCNLPVKETTGDSQQPGPDVEIYRLGVQLFERSL
ncbi:zinc finger CCCH domain-containing protein 13-like isoform X3 [Zootermopsis nevadensis]|nr:zinc finger CCCH domain-containing protein 13-like isoform X3 [Zootermopsis nevadensis]